jgi:hypothetical protein
MAITISRDLEARLRARAEALGETVEAYIDRISRAEQEVEEELVMLAFEGLHSGSPAATDDKQWAEKRRRLIEWHQQKETK